MSILSFERGKRFVAPLWLRGLWGRLWESNRWLALSAVVYAVMFVVIVGLNVVDSREVLGAPVWVKPLKFVLSGLLYTATLAWMLSFVQRGRRLGQIAGGVLALALFVEIGLIIMQAVRGVPSHFNNTTSFDAAIFAAMGITIMVVWLANVVAAVPLALQAMENRSLAWSIRLALLLTLIGMALGMLMVRTTPEQAAAFEEGVVPALVGAHSVGVPDGGAGLPFLGWSSEGGDLRVVHFVGLHALQALPLAAIFINRFGRGLAQRRRTALVWIAGGGYAGLMWLLAWQALRGQPLLAPDGLTLAALGAVVGVTALAGALAAGGGRLRKVA